MPSQINPRSGPFPVYPGTSPPAVDVGIFTISKTGVDLKNAGTTNVFTVPAGRRYVATAISISVTAGTNFGAGTLAYQLKESGASGLLSGVSTSGSQTPAVNTTYNYPIELAGTTSVKTSCAAGNIVQVVVSASNAGSTTVTGTVFVIGFYIS